jgi:hypothetical protein
MCLLLIGLIERYIMRLCSYTVVNDHGFAPNPFGGYCTLAACTPNHQGIVLSKGDWLVGHAAAKREHRLIYAMELSETPMHFNTYYNDPRFEIKKPRFHLTWREACGDNIYHQTSNGEWQQDKNLFHTPEYLAKDTKHPRVFISKHFYYFGAKAPKLSEQFSKLIRDRQGCKCKYPEQLIKAFVEWLQTNFTTGVLGEPFDRKTEQMLARITRY